MVSKAEDNEIDLIKDFLKTRGYKSTLECFEKEDNYKNLDRKNAKVFIQFNQNVFRIYSQMTNNLNLQNLSKKQKKKQNNLQSFKIHIKL